MPGSIQLAQAGQIISNSLAVTGNSAGFSTTPQPIADLVGGLISVVLGLMGIVLVIYIVWAGWIYMSSAGEGPKVEKAKKMLSSAVIGLVLVLAAYAIANYVIGALLTATSGTTSEF